MPIPLSTCSCTRSTGSSSRTRYASCGQGGAASIVGVPICRRSYTSATDGGGIGAGNAGATAEAGAYDDL
jgi:hypothetical protein